MVNHPHKFKTCVQYKGPQTTGHSSCEIYKKARTSKTDSSVSGISYAAALTCFLLLSYQSQLMTHLILLMYNLTKAKLTVNVLSYRDHINCSCIILQRSY